MTRPLLMGIVAIAVTLGMIVAIRLITPEDRWMCNNGRWVAHGHPTTAVPTRPCR